MPKLSIIVPVYNVESYLKRCIESILAQTFTDFEVILVDDGSTDNSGEICNYYALKDKRVRVIHKKNSGVSEARNSGLQIVTSEYVTFCDGDDYYLPFWLDVLYTEMLNNKLDLIMSSFQKVNKQGEVLSKNNREIYSCEIENYKQLVAYIISRVLYKDNVCSVCLSIFKTSIIKNHKIYFRESCNNYGEDLCFLLEYILYSSKIKCINNNGYCYVQHENSMVHISESKIKLNELNEVSYHFGKRYLSVVELDNKQELLSCMHFLIMNREYGKLIYRGNICKFPEEIKKISNIKWYKKYSKILQRNIGLLKSYIGDNDNIDMYLIARFSWHKIPCLFMLHSAITYKFLLKR